MKKIIIAGTLCCALLGVPASAVADDYGLAHGASVLALNKGTEKVMEWLFPDYPLVQKFVTGVVTVGAAGYWCNREYQARDKRSFSEWDEDYGSSDTQWDCATPALVASVTLFEYRW